MSSFDMSRRTYRQFFSALGFEDDPFAYTNADDEVRLPDYFIPPPYFPSVFGDPAHPKSFVVFAPRGGGKSAQRRMIEARCTENDVLAITYDQFEFPAAKNAGDIGLYQHLQRVIRFCLMGALVSLHANAELKERLTAHDKVLLVRLCSEYLKGLNEYELKVTLDSLKGLKDKIRDFWNEWLPLISVGIETLAKKLLNADVNATEVFQNSDAVRSPYLKYQLGLLVEIILKLGFRSVYVLVDRVDEADLTGNSSSAAFQLIEPLLRDLELLEFRGVAFKFFLWDQLEPAYTKIARTDRIKQVALEWDESMLRDMWRKRLQAYSRGAISGLNDVSETMYPQSADELALIFANQSPRDFIRIGGQIFVEQQELNLSASRLQPRAVYQGIEKFCDQRAAELVSDATLHDLRKIQQIDFTIPYLANDIFREQQVRVRNRIMRWRKDGAIIDVDRIDNPNTQEKRQVKLLAIADIRLAKTLYPDLDVPSFLRGKYRKCPKCGSSVLRDWGASDTVSRCDVCQHDLLSTGPDNWEEWRRKDFAHQTRRRRRVEREEAKQGSLFDYREEDANQAE